MIINTAAVEMVLMNKAIPAYSIESETNVPRNVISRLRRGDSHFENLSLKNIMRIQKWIDDGNFKISYDYSELIEEFEADIAEGLLGDTCYIVRGDLVDAMQYFPIVSYFYTLDDAEGETVEERPTEAVLREMKVYNQI